VIHYHFPRTDAGSAYVGPVSRGVVLWPDAKTSPPQPHLSITVVDQLPAALGGHERRATLMAEDRRDVVRRGYDTVAERYRADDADPDEYREWTTELLGCCRPGAVCSTLAAAAGCRSHRT